MSTRAESRKAFAEAALGCPVEIKPASSDASFRSYWRVVPQAKAKLDAASFIVMDAPVEHEDCGPFLDVAARLHSADLKAPEILAQALDKGFLLLSDLGTRTLLPHLTDKSVDAHYEHAMHIIVQMQRKISCRNLPRYDGAKLQQEMALLPEWFLQTHLGLSLSNGDKKLLAHTFGLLEARARGQEQAFVHRDFHSRNLMLTDHTAPHHALALIDFQDAVLGPCSYDLVSLLRDCYIRWPEKKIARWRKQFVSLAQDAGLFEKSEAEFAIDFDWMGLQRHIKVLGIFARLNYRDNKANYLKDLPLVLDYALSIAALYPELSEFAEWLKRKTNAVDLTVERI
jgi:N-acetylmuramate 1-kinase